MNTQILRSSVLALALAAAPLAQADMHLQVDCTDRALPTQAVLAAAMGIGNLDQAYEARVRLANVVNRACQRPGQPRVYLVLKSPRGRAAATTQIARAERR